MELQPVPFILLAMFVGYRALLWTCRTRYGGLAPWQVRLEPQTLVDASDGKLALVGKTFQLVAGVAFCLVMIALGALALTDRETILAGLLVLAFGLACGWALFWWYGRALGTVRLSKPGELKVAQWPVPEGALTKAVFVRQVDPSCRLVGLHGQLVQQRRVWRRVSGGSSSGGSYRRVWETIEIVPLGPGAAKQKGPRIKAVWNFEVPPREGEHPRDGFERMFAFFGWCDERRWHFEVALNVEGLPDDDSVFPFAIGASDEVASERPRRRSAA